MKVSIDSINVSSLYSDILRGAVIIPDYQRKYCWTEEKTLLFIDSLMRDIPIGMFQFRKREGWERFEVVDGLHRIRTIFNILLGKGIYFNFEKQTFTTNPNDFDYGKVAKGTLPYISIPDKKGIIDVEKSLILHEPYYRIYKTKLLAIVYEGSNEEVKLAFDRINEKGVAYTPTFNVVEKETIFEL